MKRFFLATAALLCVTPAWAQNPTCPTRPTSDSSNACASTAFVHNVAGGGVVVPSTVCNGIIDARATIQALIDANPGSILSFPVGTCIITRTPGQPYGLIVNNAIAFQGLGPYAAIRPDTSFPTNADVVYVVPTASASWSGYFIRNIIIGDGTHGRDAVRIDTQTAGNNGFFNTQWYGNSFQGVTANGGWGLHHINDAVANVNGGFFSSTIGPNVYLGGIFLENSGDSLNLVGGEAALGGSVRAKLVPGAYGPFITGMNVTSAGSVQVDCGSGTEIGPGNTIEAGVISTNANNSVIDLNGSTCTIGNVRVFDNNISNSLVGQTPTLIRAGFTANLNVRSNRLTVQSDYVPIVITNNSTNAIVEVNNTFVDTTGVLTTKVTPGSGGTKQTLTTAFAPTINGLPYMLDDFNLAFTAAMTNGQIPVGQTGGPPLPKTISGDATLAASGALTFNTVNAGVGTFGSATQAPQITVNAKGLVTAAANVTITGTTPGGAAGGSLAGTYPNPTLTAVISGSTVGSATQTPVLTYTNEGRLTTVSLVSIALPINGGGITGLGTGVATALGVNVGSAGAFVTFNGALGSPSSVGTLPAHTLGGTISGGGNQINNVIIGTTTPLAGFFTTLSATTSIISPIHAGGSATGSTLTLESTSGTGTTDAIAFQTASQVYRGGISTGGLWTIGPNVAPNTGVLLTINANTVALPVPTFASTILQIGGSDSTAPRVSIDSFATNGTVAFRRSNGTAASPSQVLTGQTLGAFFFEGRDTTGYDASDAPAVRGASTETFTTTAHGTKIVISTIPNGSLLSADAFTVNQSGGIGVGTASDPGLGMIYTNAATFMIRTKTSYSTGAGAGAGTMTNAPSAGNPTKWIPVDDNGTTRYIPAW